VPSGIVRSEGFGCEAFTVVSSFHCTEATPEPPGSLPVTVIEGATLVQAELGNWVSSRGGVPSTVIGVLAHADALDPFTARWLSVWKPFASVLKLIAVPAVSEEQPPPSSIHSIEAAGSDELNVTVNVGLYEEAMDVVSCSAGLIVSEPAVHAAEASAGAGPTAAAAMASAASRVTLMTGRRFTHRVIGRRAETCNTS
jgi:hypothetical protein